MVRTPLLRMGGIALLLAAVVLPAAGQIQVQNAFPALTFDFPVDIQAPPDGSDRLMVVGLDGFIWVFNNDPAVPSKSVFLDIRNRVLSGGELGLLGLAFDPDYANNGFFYVNYTASSPRRTVIARYSVTADPDVADPNSELVLLEQDQPFDNHNAGQLQFGPDGYLYVGFGDGGSFSDPEENGEDPTNMLGSMVRIDVHGGGLAPDCGAGPNANYTIPADNPLMDGPGGICDELWAYGLRNPWRYSFDDSGRLWVADVGQNAREEINWLEGGLNYGWDIMEGFICHEPSNGCDMAGLALPVHDYPHDFATGGFAVTGGYVYIGTDCAALTGTYVYGDYISQNIWSLSFDDSGMTGNTLAVPGSGLTISTFGLDQQGELLISSYGSVGTLHRFACAATADLSVTLTPQFEPIEIPADGGSYGYQLRVENNGTSAAAIDLWIDIEGPSGVGVTLGPISRNLPAGGTLNRNLNQNIPAGAPAGDYTHTVSVGTFPSTVEASDSFPFTKLGGATKGEAVAGWAYSIEATSDSKEPAPVPQGVQLLGNYPNPFNPTTLIRYSLAAASQVRLTVHDALGREVAVLVSGLQNAGTQNEAWTAADTLPSGLYYYRLETEAGVAVRPMLLLK